MFLVACQLRVNSSREGGARAVCRYDLIDAVNDSLTVTSSGEQRAVYFAVRNSAVTTPQCAVEGRYHEHA